ncbi:MAG TPA: DivIVA domain-containing protein [Solirubrobacteraceae bacterium]|jgi:DivIVA domain-containing protein|nr:DivIVA domain-containing protein [Solirubrobacteraceae bacterium]
MDRQAIERRDFPIVRRGYDPASVDAHLRALAGQVEDLSKQAGSAGRDSLAATAGAQVQAILEAAQASAQAIETEAAEQAARAREEADADARRTREQAVAAAQERVAAVTAATEALLQRVGAMDGETRTLVESLRGGAGRLVGDLEALSVEMGTLYDAAAARTSEPAPAAGGPEAAVAANGASAATAASAPAPAAPVQPEPAVAVAASAPAPSSAQAPAPAPDSPLAGGDDLDGARLVALNMALNGDSREATDRYLAENYDVPDRERLLDEVFAAIEA